MQIIANEATGVIQTELKSGEKLLWAGVPRRSFTMRPWQAQSLIFAIGWFCIIGFITVQVVFFDLQGPPFGKWVLPYFWIWGGYFVVYGALIRPIQTRNSSFYGVTTERVLLVQSGKNKQIRSLALNELDALRLNEKRDGSGDIIFGLPPFNPIYTHRAFRISREPQEVIPGESVQPCSDVDPNTPASR